MTAVEIREKLRDRNLVYVASVIGIPYQKLRRWYLGKETALSIEELRLVINYLRR